MIHYNTLRAALIDHRDDGNTYVTARQLSKKHEQSPRAWGKALSQAADKGWVERWSQSEPITYRITL